MPMGCREPCPLPDDPVLAELVEAMRKAGQWAEVVDTSWRLVYMTDDPRLVNAGMRGSHCLSGYRGRPPAA
jgi:hypothetical protein